MVTVCAMMAHNLGRKMQMLAKPRELVPRQTPSGMDTPNAGHATPPFSSSAPARLTQPKGELTLTLSSNPMVKKDLLHFLEALKEAA